MSRANEAGPDRLAPGYGAGPFVDAVLAQLARGIGDAGLGAQERLDELADRLTSILLAAEQNDAESAVPLLSEDVTLLRTIFQNIDLL